MSRFKKLSHTIWHCQYHIVWVPKYRYRVLAGKAFKVRKYNITNQRVGFGLAD